MKVDGQKVVKEAKEILYREGEQSNGIYLLLDGQMETYKVKENVETILQVFSPGEVLGTLTMISKAPRTSWARAQTRCVLLYYSNDFLKDAFKEIPIWSQAVIKDAIVRQRETEDKLIEATTREKLLQKNLGTQYHHSAQFASLMAALMRKGTLIDDTKTPLFPAKDVVVQAETILMRPCDYFEKIQQIFIKCGLFVIEPNQKYGPSIVKPNPQLLEDYANFALLVSKKGMTDFVPSRYYKYMQSLIKISRRFNNLERFETVQLVQFLKEDFPNEEIEVQLKQLELHKVITDSKTSIQFSPAKVQKTIIYESIAKFLKELPCA
jgi:CRP/FNR family cyclic AMP-dependent transcriptional regulator